MTVGYCDRTVNSGHRALRDVLPCAVVGIGAEALEGDVGGNRGLGSCSLDARCYYYEKLRDLMVSQDSVIRTGRMMDEGNPGVGVATLLAGAEPFKVGNVNETYRAQIRLSDESTVMAIVKDLDLRQLANEVLASTMARAVGLPTPNVYLTLARPDVISLNKAPYLEGGDRIMFGSTDVKTPSVIFHYEQDKGAIGSLLSSIISWDGLGRCYGYDTWIANIDRNAGNLLFGSPKEVWLIDHGHSFTGPVWAATDLKSENDYRHRLSEWLTPHMNDTDRKLRAAEAAGLESVIPKLDIDALIRSSMVDRLLPADDIDALRNFLSDRCSYVAYYTNKALGVPSII